MKKVFLSMALGGLVAMPAYANDAESVWIEVADNASVKWSGKRGSGLFFDDGGKKKVAYGYLYQMENKSKKTFNFGKVIVHLSDCKNGYGYVLYNDMEGAFTGKDAFVRFGGTIADALGTTACTAWDNEVGKVSREDAGDTWELAARAKDSGNEYILKTDTVRARKFNNKPAVTALFAYKNKKKNTTEYSDYVIAESDCKRGYGAVYELDFSGKVLAKDDFVKDGRSMIAAVADTLCARL